MDSSQYQLKTRKFRQLIQENDIAGARLVFEEVKTKYPVALVNSLAQQLPDLASEPSSHWNYSSNGPWLANANHLGTTTSTPLVSIIIVSFNSSKDVLSLLPTIKDQTYTNWELIILENGESGDLDKRLKSTGVSYTYRKLSNVGFAEASNIGEEIAEGELLLLLNPDTALDRNCIKRLVHSLRIDSSAAAVTPLILFYEEFLKLSIDLQCEALYSLNVLSLQKQLQYKKIFVIQGKLVGNKILPDSEGMIVIDISLGGQKDQSIILELMADENSPVKSTPQDIAVLSFVGSSHPKTIAKIGNNCKVIMPISDADLSSARYLINNAGSSFDSSGNPFDRDFGKEEMFASSSSKSYVDALCGCCALVRRSILAQRKLFISEFFAYYEDSELSLWIKKNGMRILHDPCARVFHKHSESMDEGSVLWNYLVKRSHLLFTMIKDATDDTEASIRLTKNLITTNSHLKSNYPSLHSKISEYDANLSTGRSRNTLACKTKRSIGIYNSYWKTLGGGEKHALEFARILEASTNCRLILLSENDFDVDQLLERFCIKFLVKPSKLIIGSPSEFLTSQFYIFVNSTYRSNLVSYAYLSFYLVSFPHPSPPPKLVSSYRFLFNSEYSMNWGKKYWPNHAGDILYPIIGNQSLTNEHTLEPPSYTKKTKSILVVGRFNYSGHCKNQHIIAKAFLKLQRTDWTLNIFGACNYDEISSVTHLEDTRRVSGGNCNINIIDNAKNSDIIEGYQNASIFVHACGLGVDKDRFPEKLEHFGIAPFDALQNGCIPVLYNYGGPALMIKRNVAHFFFSDEDELCSAISSAIAYSEKMMASGNLKTTCYDIKVMADSLIDSNEDVIKKILSLAAQ